MEIDQKPEIEPLVTKPVVGTQDVNSVTHGDGVSTQIPVQVLAELTVPPPNVPHCLIGIAVPVSGCCCG